MASEEFRSTHVLTQHVWGFGVHSMQLGAGVERCLWGPGVYIIVGPSDIGERHESQILDRAVCRA